MVTDGERSQEDRVPRDSRHPSHPRPGSVARRALTCAAAFLLVHALPFAEPGATAPRGTALADAAEVEALAQRAAQLDALMKDAYADVWRDHALVRGEGFADSMAVSDVDLAVQAAEKARTDAEVSAAEIVRPLLAGRREQKGALSASSAEIVLADVVEQARKARDAKPRDLLLAAARRAFAAETADAAWDGPFQALALVRAFRAAQAALTAAREAAKGPLPGAAGTEDDMVPLARGRGFVGPWSGWIQGLSEKENKRQVASLKPVYVDRYEVTCARYAQFITEQRTGKREEFLPAGWTLDEAGEVVIPEGRARHPVTGVTFSQATAFARAMGKRLPTEDEWELCAAGLEKDGRTFPFGAEVGERRLCTRDGKSKGTADVDAYPDDVTPEGVVGMAGNVAEMVATQSDRTDLPRHKIPKDSAIVVRGGSFRAPDTEATTTWRWTIGPDDQAEHVGFRCVMDESDYRRKFGR